MKKFLKALFVLCILGAIVYFVVYKYEIRIYQIDGTSMYPTFNAGELVISMKEDNYVRGDIVVYNLDNANIIKRIIALPSEKIAIKADGKVYINDKQLIEKYIESETNPGEQQYPFTVEDNEFFVIGDNRLDSYDSRYFKVGAIPRNRIKGKVIFSINTFRIFNKEEY